MPCAVETHLYLVRHGETDWNREQRLQGTFDVPLNSAGVAQPRLLVEYFVWIPPPRPFASASPRDRAFCFYYEDNLDALRAAGADLVAFSPLDDRELPDALDALYVGGGYPELWAEALTANVNMKAAVRRFIESGRAVYAECGGLMYLAESIQGRDGQTWPMVGALPFNVVMTERLQRFGYVEVTLTRDCVWGAAGTAVRGHSFHCSRIADLPTDVPRSYQ
jgi:cobyrinic acid a,c-diamide synthase